MGWCIYKTVAGQNAILAGPTGPIISGMVITNQIEELHAPIATNNIATRSFFSVTSMVMSHRPEVIQFKQTPFYLSCP
jgi:hypothetical protein